KIPDWDFNGFHHGYDDLVYDMYLAYRDHGILMVAGGYLDQPPEFWKIIRTCEALYNTRYAERLPEYERKFNSGT
ncbi:MAG: hypothetical protein KO463_01080, partial [Candidatus Methanofastidiosa archaeon]|nr:hypothetical protein [Candidatus Methanofastidiosa archaeon]